MQTHHEQWSTTNLDKPSYYNNRELSWLDFNSRVLEEAVDDQNALLERYKFLSIFLVQIWMSFSWCVSQD